MDGPLKLILTYELIPETAQEYRQFALGRYIPTMQAMGLQMSEAWHTAYGEVPNRRIVFVCSEGETMSELLSSETWLSLNRQLGQFVTDFTFKVVPYRSGIQI